MGTWRCCHQCSLLIAYSQIPKQAARAPCQEVVVVMSTTLVDQRAGYGPCQPSRAPEQHLEDLQKACVLRWRGSEGTTKERRVLQPSSGEDAGIRALLSRVGARRAEGGHRFARVYSCRSAAHLSAPANTDLREARVLCWLYKGRWLLRGSDNLHGRSNGVGDWAGREANLYIFAYRAGARRAVSQGYASRGNGGNGSHDDVLRCYTYMPGGGGIRLHCTALRRW